MTTGQNEHRDGGFGLPPGGWVREHYGFSDPEPAISPARPAPAGVAPQGRARRRRTVLAGGALGLVLTIGFGGLAVAQTDLGGGRQQDGGARSAPFDHGPTRHGGGGFR